LLALYEVRWVEDPAGFRESRSCKVSEYVSQNMVDSRQIGRVVDRLNQWEQRRVVSDSELVDRAKRRDVEAFGALVARYERSVLAVALAGLRDIHAAEDVTQATLLLAFQRLASLNDGSRFGPWLMRIARRQVVEAARHRRVRVKVPGDDSMEQFGFDAHASDWIEHEHLLGLVNRLPDRERVLIGLRFFDGRSVSEIAEITARPLGTVTKQLSRATARLRAWLEKENAR
jgi:RNA polymerase sigma-70 factor, ECF subfamily